VKDGDGVILAALGLLALVVVVLALRKPAPQPKTLAESIFGNAPDIITAFGTL
jgi:hypothetical protein